MCVSKPFAVCLTVPASFPYLFCVLFFPFFFVVLTSVSLRLSSFSFLYLLYKFKRWVFPCSFIVHCLRIFRFSYYYHFCCFFLDFVCVFSFATVTSTDPHETSILKGQKTYTNLHKDGVFRQEQGFFPREAGVQQLQ